MRHFKLFILGSACLLAFVINVHSDDIERGYTVPLVRFIDEITGEERFEEHVEGDVWLLTNLNSGLVMIRVQENESQVWIPQGSLIIGPTGNDSAELSTNSVGSLTLRPRTNLIFNVGNRIYTWPTVDGTSGQQLQTDGAGVLSWSASGGGNSFETISVPAGTNPVADSSTDTLAITETSPLVITGTASTDTIDITWSTLVVGDGGTGATSLTDGGILLGSGTGAITALGVATNGQIPIGDGTTDPVLAALTGTANEITVTNGAGSITLDIPTSPVFTTSEEVSGSEPRTIWTDTDAASDDFEAVLQDSVFRIADTTDGITSLIHYSDNTVGLGEVGKAPRAIHFITDGTGNGEINLPGLSVGAAEIDFPNIRFTRTAYYENLAAADDNKSLGSWDRPVTIRGIRVHYNGSPTTIANIALEDGAGNAMTHGTTSAAAESAVATTIPVTAANTLTAGELLRFDVTNAVSPETDDYTLDIDWSYD